MQVDKNELESLREKIKELSDLQDKIYEEFLIKNNLEKNKHIEPFIFDYIFNGFDFSYEDALKKIEIRKQYGVH
jgi:hypothetical protein